MTSAILVVNAGSSSIKFSMFMDRSDTLDLTVRGHVEGLFTTPRFVSKAPDGTVKSEKSWPAGEVLGHAGAIDHIISHLRSEFGDASILLGIGHRVVHGGKAFKAPVRVDARVLSHLEAFIPLAPLHQPYNLAPIRRALERVPDLPQVACFDTSFHRTQPAVAQTYALPADLREAGVMRYGFHGLSYEYIASVLPAIDPVAAQGRTIVLHLGNGASMCALAAGRSVDSTMGFTAVEGLPMGTRSGSLDPGVILYLKDQLAMDARDIEDLIYNKSGLLGVSGISSDMRTLLASEEPQAKLATDLFVYRIRCWLGALTAALGGLDAVVFTAGIGENSPEIRSRVCNDAGWLGIKMDDAANVAGHERISAETSRVAVFVVPTNEELMIARHTRRLLTQ